MVGDPTRPVYSSWGLSSWFWQFRTLKTTMVWDISRYLGATTTTEALGSANNGTYLYLNTWPSLLPSPLCLPTWTAESQLVCWSDLLDDHWEKIGSHDWQLCRSIPAPNHHCHHTLWRESSTFSSLVLHLPTLYWIWPSIIEIIIIISPIIIVIDTGMIPIEESPVAIYIIQPCVASAQTMKEVTQLKAPIIPIIGSCTFSTFVIVMIMSEFEFWAEAPTDSDYLSLLRYLSFFSFR